MDYILKLNCVFDLSTIMASFYFIARMRFHCEIKKVIEKRFKLISWAVVLMGVCSWYCFYYSAALILTEMKGLSPAASNLITLHTILNIFINVLVWYLFIKINRNVRV